MKVKFNPSWLMKLPILVESVRSLGGNHLSEMSVDMITNMTYIQGQPR